MSHLDCRTFRKRLAPTVPDRGWQEWRDCGNLNSANVLAKVGQRTEPETAPKIRNECPTHVQAQNGTKFDRIGSRVGKMSEAMRDQ